MTRPDSSAPQMARGHVAQDTPFALIIAVGCVAAFALSWPLMVKVWTDGLYVDTDDAMRMVQVRDWLAGQGWYDLRALRLDPPAGTLMHWSRVVDLPLAALIQNALDANLDQRPVVVSATHEGGELRIAVRDRGQGMLLAEHPMTGPRLDRPSRRCLRFFSAGGSPYESRIGSTTFVAMGRPSFRAGAKRHWATAFIMARTSWGSRGESTEMSRGSPVASTVSRRVTTAPQ